MIILLTTCHIRIPCTDKNIVKTTTLPQQKGKSPLTAYGLYFNIPIQHVQVQEMFGLEYKMCVQKKQTNCHREGCPFKNIGQAYLKSQY